MGHNGARPGHGAVFKVPPDESPGCSKGNFVSGSDSLANRDRRTRDRGRRGPIAVLRCMAVLRHRGPLLPGQHVAAGGALAHASVLWPVRIMVCGHVHRPIGPAIIYVINASAGIAPVDCSAPKFASAREVSQAFSCRHCTAKGYVSRVCAASWSDSWCCSGVRPGMGSCVCSCGGSALEVAGPGAGALGVPATGAPGVPPAVAAAAAAASASETGPVGSESTRQASGSE